MHLRARQPDRRRWTRRVLAWIAAAAVAGAAVGCSVRSDEQLLLPWFKLDTTPTQLGGFGSGGITRTYSARHLGFVWAPVPNVDTAAVVSDDVVLVASVKGTGLFQRGDFTPRFPCRLYVPWGVPPSAQEIDCLRLEGRLPMFVDANEAERVVMTRSTANGTLVGEMTLIAPVSHRFNRNHSYFYDPAGQPHMVATDRTMKDDSPLAADCVLVSARSDAPAIAARRADLTIGECMKASAWTALLGRALIGNQEVLDRHRPVRPEPPLRKCQRHEARNPSCQ